MIFLHKKLSWWTAACEDNSANWELVLAKSGLKIWQMQTGQQEPTFKRLKNFKLNILLKCSKLQRQNYEQVFIDCQFYRRFPGRTAKQ